MKTFAFVLAAAAISAVVAECPNGCSGHGTCGSKDACDCFDNWMGGDCSQRVCPFGLSFVDTPLGDLDHSGAVTHTDVGTQSSNAKLFETGWQGSTAEEAHFYAECSNKGFCDRATGACECFDGFTGSSCQRTTCPNDCSGHGQCYTLREIAAGPNVDVPNPDGSGTMVGRNFQILDVQHTKLVTSGVSAKFDYNLWDADKNQACVCDVGYFGPDCSLRQCPKGNDPLTNDPKHCGGQACSSEMQYAYVSFPAGAADTEFYLEWQNMEAGAGLIDSKLRSETFTLKSGLTGDEYAELLQDVIETFPNGAMNGVTVTCNAYDDAGTPLTGASAHLKCVTELAAGDTVELKMDFTNGPQGNVKAPVAHVLKVDNSIAVDQAKALVLTFVAAEGTSVQAQASTAYRLRMGLVYSNAFATDGATTFAVGSSPATPVDGNQENSPCSNRGLCDYSTGTCSCFAGYTREDCSVQNALAM